jgi:hypothetical protein
VMDKLPPVPRNDSDSGGTDTDITPIEEWMMKEQQQEREHNMKESSSTPGSNHLFGFLGGKVESIGIEARLS